MGGPCRTLDLLAVLQVVLRGSGQAHRTDLEVDVAAVDFC